MFFEYICKAKNIYMKTQLLFSRWFPVYHEKAGQPTHFVEKYLNAIGLDYRNETYLKFLVAANPEKDGDILKAFAKSLSPEVTEKKSHTIRAGFKRNTGDDFQPSVWLGKPYKSKRIIFAPQNTYKRLYQIEIDEDFDIYLGNIDRTTKMEIGEAHKQILAANDGLTVSEMRAWFVRNDETFTDFHGQVLIWDKSLFY